MKRYKIDVIDNLCMTSSLKYGRKDKRDYTPNTEADIQVIQVVQVVDDNSDKEVEITSDENNSDRQASESIVEPEIQHIKDIHYIREDCAPNSVNFSVGRNLDTKVLRRFKEDLFKTAQLSNVSISQNTISYDYNAKRHKHKRQNTEKKENAERLANTELQISQQKEHQHFDEKAVNTFSKPKTLLTKSKQHKFKCLKCKLISIKPKISYKFTHCKHQISFKKKKRSSFQNDHGNIHSNHHIKCDSSINSTQLTPLTLKHEKPKHMHPTITIDVKKVLRCDKCKFICIKATSMESHQIVHNSKAPFSCTKCIFQTDYAKTFSHHVLFHNNDRPYVCPQCTCSYNRQGNLRGHIKSHHPNLIVVCKWCDFSTGLPAVMNEHEQQHKLCHSDMGDIIKCPECRFFATERNSINLHALVHKMSPPYRCHAPDCDFHSFSKGKFNCHVLSHNEKEPFMCINCSICFKNSNQLKKHIEDKHSDVNINACLDMRHFYFESFTQYKQSHLTGIDNALQCPNCKFVASNPSSFELHQIVHEGGKLYSCPVCGFQTSCTQTFNEHILSHNKDERFICNECDMVFSISHEFNKHINFCHPHSNFFSCDHCDFQCRIPTMLSNHIKRQHFFSPENAIKCEICKFVATKASSLELHQIIHRTKKPYNCNLCDLETSSTKKFNLHALNHHEDFPFNCNICSAKFSKYSSLNKHIKHKHPDSVLTCCQADDCYFTCGTQNFMVKHLLKKHINASNTLIKCNKCKFVATKVESLALHQRIHFTSKPYVCIDCNFRSPCNSKINTHILAHYNDYPFQCPHCDKRFYRVSPLYSHIRTRHSGLIKHCDMCSFSSGIPVVFNEHKQVEHPADPNAVIKCKVRECDFIATKQSSVDHHQVIHTSAKTPYQCQKCTFNTSDANYFNRHVLSHNKDKPYFCLLCSKCYSTPHGLNGHVKRTHPESVKTCNLCDFSSGVQTILDKHILFYHSSDINNLMKCEQCTFIATKKESLQLHEQVHDSVHLQCPKCGFQGSAVSKYNVHCLRCTKDRPFQCFHCILRYVTIFDLNKHLEIKHPNHPFEKLTWQSYWDKHVLLRCGGSKFDGVKKTFVIID